jgi:hypothetical protein
VTRVMWATGGVAAGSSDVPALRWGGVLTLVQNRAIAPVRKAL